MKTKLFFAALSFCLATPSAWAQATPPLAALDHEMCSLAREQALADYAETEGGRLHTEALADFEAAQRDYDFAVASRARAAESTRAFFAALRAHPRFSEFRGTRLNVLRGDRAMDDAETTAFLNEVIASLGERGRAADDTHVMRYGSSAREARTGIRTALRAEIAPMVADARRLETLRSYWSSHCYAGAMSVLDTSGWTDEGWDCSTVATRIETLQTQMTAHRDAIRAIAYRDGMYRFCRVEQIVDTDYGHAGDTYSYSARDIASHDNMFPGSYDGECSSLAISDPHAVDNWLNTYCGETTLPCSMNNGRSFYDDGSPLVYEAGTPWAEPSSGSYLTDHGPPELRFSDCYWPQAQATGTPYCYSIRLADILTRMDSSLTADALPLPRLRAVRVPPGEEDFVLANIPAACHDILFPPAAEAAPSTDTAAEE